MNLTSLLFSKKKKSKGLLIWGLMLYASNTLEVATKHIRCIWQSCRLGRESCRNWKYVCSKMNKQMHILTHMLMLMLLNFSVLADSLSSFVKWSSVHSTVFYIITVRAFVPQNSPWDIDTKTCLKKAHTDPELDIKKIIIWLWTNNDTNMNLHRNT